MAREKDQLEEIYNDLQLANQAVRENRDLRTLLEHPLVRIEDKRTIVDQLFAERVRPIAYNFLRLLLDKRRIALLGGITSQYHQLYSALRKQVGVRVTTAVTLPDAELSGIKQLLETQWQREVVVDATVDPGILGGVVLQIGDQIVDDSVRGRLNALKQTLIR